MDEIFSLLPALFIFFFIFKRISNIFENANKENRDINEEEIIYEQSEIRQSKKDDNNTSEQLQSIESVDKEKDDSNKRDNSYEEENNVTVNRDLKENSYSRSVATKQAKTESENRKKEKDDIFPDNKLKQKDIVRGIIFKQILDKPRAKNPWEPVSKK